MAANDVWAANGDGTLWHWDGSGWTAANLPGLTVRGIDMTGPGAGWAWGTTGSGNTPIILRYYATQTFEDVPIGSTFPSLYRVDVLSGGDQRLSLRRAGRAVVAPATGLTSGPATVSTRGPIAEDGGQHRYLAHRHATSATFRGCAAGQHLL